MAESITRLFSISHPIVMQKVAVTGGAGFLGSHIIRALLDRGLQVSIIDDFSAGYIDNLRDLSIAQECIVGDLEDYAFARDSLKGADTVFHSAAEVGSVVYLHGSNAAELSAMQSNIVIDANVFKACIENGVKRIIYPSSVSVYPYDEQQGQASQFREDDAERKINPEGGYGWSKIVAEKQLSLMAPGICSGVARIFHAYGENIYIKEDKSQVIGSLIRKAVRYPREDFVIWGKGDQRRCFVYIDDALDALFRLEEYVEKNETNLTVNIGSTEEITVKDLASHVIALSKKNITPKYDPSKPSGALNRMPNLEKIERTLGWIPKTDLQTGLARTYKWAEGRISQWKL
jgi:GDP-D-mannose 3', 5'-epimerase